MQSLDMDVGSGSDESSHHIQMIFGDRRCQGCFSEFVLCIDVRSGLYEQATAARSPFNDTVIKAVVPFRERLFCEKYEKTFV